jgi:carboxypeptidase C (cathepsin A)
MRSFTAPVFATLFLTLPLGLAARAANGPDAGMRQAIAVALPGGTAAAQAGEVSQSQHGGGEGARMDADCDSHPAPAGEGGGQADPRADRARCRKLTDADIATAPIAEISKVSHHQVTIGGRPIAYTATAGTLTIRDDDGKPTASMFYVAYTSGDARRPVTFLYNGGPGSSSVWLHMGSLGPMRVRTDSPAPTHNAPFDLEPNSDSLLDKSDLVFVDAIGAGFSRPLGDTKLAAFWGTDADIDAFARGIERYLTINKRWNAPKFIFGESYGTTRSAGLSYRLQQDGVQLNGVVLLSSILNYGRRDPGFDQEMINYLPSYAAIAAYHNRLSAPPADVAAFLRDVREWARGPYALALAKGQALSAAERDQVAQKMALRDRRLTLGRYDARFTGQDVDAAGDSPEYDPSDSGISGAFVAAFHDYLAGDLGFATDLTYRPTYYASGVQWDFRHRAPGSRGDNTSPADVALDLSAAMRENPHLLLYSLNGLYDLATPFFGTEYDLGHMQLEPAAAANVRFAYYPSGHMVYLSGQALTSMKSDLAKFYDEAAPR